MTEEKINNELKKHSKEKIKAVKDNTHKFIKIFNALCFHCRKKVTRNPKTPLSSYCYTCKNTVKEIWEK